MPYALFQDEEKLSADFPTEAEAWRQAEEAGLTEFAGGKTVLVDGYSIQAFVDGGEDDIIVPPPIT
jgi:hypothetical protein